MAAGPLANGGALRGVLIFQTETLDQALALANADPTVKARQLEVELHPWTGPRGIGAVYFQRHRESGGQAPVRMMKVHLTLGQPVHSLSAKRLFAGELRGDGLHIAVFRDLTAGELDSLKALPGAKLLDWYVADGVLP